MKKPFVFYGWIEMSVDTNKTTCTIRFDGHNYNKTAGQFIIAENKLYPTQKYFTKIIK